MGTCTSKITPEEPDASMVGSGFYPDTKTSWDTLLRSTGSSPASQGIRRTNGPIP